MSLLNTRCRLPHEAVESPLVYTKCRDIHSVGVILLQMLMGSDVMERFPDVHTALRNCTRSTALCEPSAVQRYLPIASISPHLQQQAVDMLTQSKKHPVSSGSLLANMQGRPVSPVTVRSAAIPIPGTSTLGVSG